MPTAVSELSQIPIQHMIGGPMQAIVEAQTMASLATINYIESIGLDEYGETRMVSFTTSKTNPDPNVTAPIVSKVDAAILVIAPPPSIRVSEATISFKAKLTDIETKERSMSVKASFEVEARPPRVKLKGSVTAQVASNSTSRREREYSLDVNVKIVQDEIPAGLSKLLDILEAMM